MARISFRTRTGKKVSFTVGGRKSSKRRSPKATAFPFAFAKGAPKKRRKGMKAGNVYQMDGKKYVACRDGMLRRVRAI
jgi:hypothetical protein